ncbi:hypothetical protein [Kribbella sp. NPDC048915]|uniref:hypothetical protein n=1 Tax=Kribbella sp. NPDC048915 TaxID=3155148 RepID=UPI0033F79CC5
MSLSVRRVSVLVAALALLLSTAVTIRLANTAEAVTCVRSSSTTDSVLGGLGFQYRNWPGGNAKVRVTYSTSNAVKTIRVRMAQDGKSSWTILSASGGRKVTKTVSVGYHSKGNGTLWFEPRGDSTRTGRTLYSFCLYKG